MKPAAILLFLLLLVLIPCVTADNLKFALNQTEYYFQTGENAIINLQADNTHEKNLEGTLKYTITQTVNQGGFSYRRSNTQTTTLAIKQGSSKIPLGFGTSDQPMQLDADIEYTYKSDGTNKVKLRDIKIHFVPEDPKDKNKQKQRTSTSEKVQEEKQQKSNSAEQQERRQEFQKQMNKEQHQNPAQKKVQNNQLAQDSKALKKQMRRQMEEQKKMEQEFQKKLSQNQKFQKKHQNILKKDYNLTGADFDLKNNNTGDFKLNYQKPDGKKASLEGTMQDGEVSKLRKDTAEKRQKILDRLKQDGQFKKHQEKLAEHGYNQTDTRLNSNNKTKVKLSYKNATNHTATIQATLDNETVEDVQLEMEEEKQNHLQNLLLALTIILIVAAGLYAYKKYKKDRRSESATTTHYTNDQIDYRTESLRLLGSAEKDFERKKYKDAYSKAAQALRLYLRYDNDLAKEVTNDEIIDFLKKKNKKYKKAKESFDLCTLVEFAKYKPNRKDFTKVTRNAREIIK